MRRTMLKSKIHRGRITGSDLNYVGSITVDADLLDAADAAIRPAHGELAEAGFTRDHLTVTDTIGVRAGEEMLAWMHARVRTRRTTPSWRCGTS